jgi:hypothetical protein
MTAPQIDRIVPCGYADVPARLRVLVIAALLAAATSLPITLWLSLSPPAKAATIIYLDLPTSTSAACFGRGGWPI